MTLEEVNRLTKEEKLELLETVWASLLPDVEQDEPPAWHDSIIEERLSDEAEGTAEWIDIDTAFEEIRNGLK